MAELYVTLGDALGIGFCCSITAYSPALTLPSLAWNPIFDENDKVTNPLPEAFKDGEHSINILGERVQRPPFISFKTKINEDTIRLFEEIICKMKEILRKEQLIIDSGLTNVGVEDVEKILIEDFEKQEKEKCPE